MKSIRAIRSCCVLLLTVSILLLTGCLEIVGQRITIHHDAAKDELNILIQYEGIHDSGNDQFGNGAEQVANAVTHGHFMLFDWPFHIQPEQVKENVDNDAMPPALRSFLKRFGETVTVKTLGHHRDPQARIGGSQLVTIRQAKAFIKSANAALSAIYIEQNREAENAPIEFVRTMPLVMAAAKNDHQWLALDGHALRFEMPIHPREWAALKAMGLKETFANIQRMTTLALPNREREEGNLMRVIQLLSASAITFSDVDGMLSIRLGNTKKTSTLRIDHGKPYLPNLEAAVTKASPGDFDEAMLKVMVGDKPAKDAELYAALATWGPPEDRVRGLMRAVRGNDPALAAKAAKALEDFAQKWNTDEGYPLAPRSMADTDEYLQAWAKWYEKMLRFPMDEAPSR